MPRTTLPRLLRTLPSPTALVVRLSVRHPLLTLLLTLAPCLTALLVLVFANALHVSSDQTVPDFFVRSNRHTLASDARAAARNAFPVPAPRSLGVAVERTRPSSAFSLALVVADAPASMHGPDPQQHSNVNLLRSPRALRVLAAAEDIVLRTDGYAALCFSDPLARECNASRVVSGAPIAPTCAAPRSVLQAPTLLGLPTSAGLMPNPGQRDPKTACTRRIGRAPASIRAANVSAFAAAVRAGRSGVDNIDALMSRNATQRADTWLLVSAFILAQPFTGFAAPDDRPAAQRALYDEWIMRATRAVQRTAARLGAGEGGDGQGQPLFVYLASSRFGTLLFSDVVRHDFRLAAPALAAVALLLLLHTRSPLLVVAAVLQVFVAFAPAYVLYYYVLGQRYFAALHAFAVYLVLGIAVDDVFIFVDAWRQTSGRVLDVTDGGSEKREASEADGHGVQVDLAGDCAKDGDRRDPDSEEGEDDRALLLHAERAYRRAVGGMAVTSVTTAAAFAVTASSPLMPVSTFGTWACILVLLQFVLVATAFLAVLVLWEKHIRHRAWVWKSWHVPGWRRGSRKERSLDADADAGSASEIAKDDRVADAATTGADKSSNSDATRTAPAPPRVTAAAPHEHESGADDAGDAEDIRVAGNRALSENAAVTVDPMRLASFLDSDAGAKAPGANDGEIRPENLGFLERLFHGAWTDTLHRFRYVLTALAVALLVASTVLALRLQPMVEPEKMLPDSHPAVRASNILQNKLGGGQSDNLQQVRVLWGVAGVDRANTSRFRPSEEGAPILHASFDLKPAAAQRHILSTCRALSANASLAQARRVRCWIEDFLAWRTARNKPGFMTYKTDLALLHEVVMFGTYLDEWRDQPYLKYLTEQDVMMSPDLRRVVATEVRVTAPVHRNAPPEQTRALIARWDDALARVNARAPRTMGDAVGSVDTAWPFYVAQRELIRSLRVNVGAMLGVVLVLLTVATRHVVSGLVATASLGGIVCGVLGAAHLAGWRLGMAESLIAVVSIGYSFDGVCHVSTSFARARRRGGRCATDQVREALTAIGGSIVFGTASTAASTAVLLAAQVVVVRKLAILVVVTMGLTVVWSLVLLPSVLMVVVPRGAGGGGGGTGRGRWRAAWWRRRN